MVSVEDRSAVIGLIRRLHHLRLDLPACRDVASPSRMAPDVDRPTESREELQEVRVDAVRGQLKVQQESNKVLAEPFYSQGTSVRSIGEDQSAFTVLCVTTRSLDLAKLTSSSHTDPRSLHGEFINEVIKTVLRQD